MIRRFVSLFITLFAFVLIAVPTSAQVHENIPEPCEGVLTVCNMLLFGAFEDSGNLRMVASQKIEDPMMAQLVLTDGGVNELFAGFGSKNIVSLDEATDLVSEDVQYLEGVGEYRVFVGETNLTGTLEPITFFFFTDGNTIYNVISVGEFEGFFEYIEDVTTGDDWTVTPDGYMNFTGL